MHRRQGNLAVVIGLFACLTVGTSSVNALVFKRDTATDAESETTAPRARIVSPSNGATVSRTFTVEFGLKGMNVAPAGIEYENSGHFHLLIDSSELPPPNQPMSDDYLHFDDGQIAAQIELPPGRHTLQLIMGDHNHVPHDPLVMSERISIRVR